MGDALGTGFHGGFIEGRAKLPDLDKVVEMACLEAGVLSVVCEAQEFPRAGGEASGAPKLPNRREGQNGGRGAATFGAERGELAEIGMQPKAIRDSAAQTEPERRGEEVTIQSTFRFAGIRPDAYGTRKLFPAGRPQPCCALMIFKPIIGESGQHRVGVGGPGLRCTNMEKPGLLALLRLKIGCTPGRENADACLLIGGHSHGVVLLSALAAEHERQEHAASVPGHELLSLKRHVPFIFGLNGRVHGVTATDELVESEGEAREASLGVGAGVAGHECRLDFRRAPALVSTCQLRKLGAGTVLAGDAARMGADESGGFILGAKPEGGFNPD